MTADAFRKIALRFPGAVESSHMDHPDFRREGKIFATLGPAGSGWGMLKLTPEEQSVLLSAKPDIFTPAKGAWGRQGSTLLDLAAACDADAIAALELAWKNVAPKTRPIARGRRKNAAE